MGCNLQFKDSVQECKLSENGHFIYVYIAGAWSLEKGNSYRLLAAFQLIRYLSGLLGVLSVMQYNDIILSIVDCTELRLSLRPHVLYSLIQRDNQV